MRAFWNRYLPETDVEAITRTLETFRAVEVEASGRGLTFTTERYGPDDIHAILDGDALEVVRAIQSLHNESIASPYTVYCASDFETRLALAGLPPGIDVEEASRHITVTR